MGGEVQHVFPQIISSCEKLGCTMSHQHQETRENGHFLYPHLYQSLDSKNDK